MLKQLFKCVFPILLFFVVENIFIANSEAYQKRRHTLNNSCTATPQLWSISSSPPITNKTSELRRKSGSSHFLPKPHAIISGQILDAWCTPIPNAIILIWQEQTQEMSQAGIDGTGTAVTDNMGNFSFHTIDPLQDGEKKQYAYIKIHVLHRNFFPLETKMFIANDSSKIDNEEWLKMKSANRSLLTASCVNCYTENPMKEDKEYQFNIVLEGKSPYRSY